MLIVLDDFRLLLAVKGIKLAQVFSIYGFSIQSFYSKQIPDDEINFYFFMEVDV